MNISPFVSHIPKTTGFSPSFKSVERSYAAMGADGKYSKVMNNSWAVRGELDWKANAKFFGSHFKDKEKVNVYSLASSDGSEAYMLAISLIETLGEKEAQKFFPIKAFDKDEYIAGVAKSGKWNLMAADLRNILDLFPNAGKYLKKSEVPMKINNDSLSERTATYEVSDILKRAVRFEKGDLLEEIKNIDDEDGSSLVFCRNVLPYLESLKTATAQQVSSLLGLYMEEGSVFVTGGYDLELTDLNRNLYLRDFKHVNREKSSFVYIKTDPWADC